MNQMKLLVLDTSGPVCGVAVMEGESVLCEYTLQIHTIDSHNSLCCAEICKVPNMHAKNVFF